MPDPDSQQYHLVLAVDGRPTMRGWWADRETADRKYREWIGARITLTDEADDQDLTAWP